jgi:hypothetical protein
MYNFTDKVRVEKILVAGASTTLQAVGETLFNETAAANTIGANTYQPGERQLEIGQIGIYDANTNTSLDATATAAVNPAIYIAQGRDFSNDAAPLPVRKVEKSLPIVPAYGAKFVGEVCAIPTNSTWVLGGATGGAGVVNVSDNTEYSLRIAFNGRRTDIYNGRNTPAINPYFESPDYTQLIADGAVADVGAARDHLLQNFGMEVYLAGNGVVYNPSVLVFALDSANAGAGTQTVSSLSVGDVVTIGWTPANPVAINVEITESIKESFDAAITAGDITGDELVVPMVTTTAAETASGLHLAGDDTHAVDQLLIISPDTKLAAHDKILQTKERLDIGSTSGFASTVTLTNSVAPSEGKGLGRHWQLFYESTDGLRKFESTIPGLDGQRIAYPSDIVVGTKYAAYLIYHSSRGMASNGLASESPLLTILLVPCCEEALKNSIEGVLNPYFASSANASFGGTLNGSGQVEVPVCPS